MVELAHEELSEWAKEELENGNRVKASRIQRVAERVKERYEAEMKIVMAEVYRTYRML